MKVGVPGEFHEDRWQRTAEDSERRVLPRTREAGPIGYKLSRGEEGLLAGLRHGHPAHRHLSGILAWQSVLLTGLRHGYPAHKYLSAILAWRSGLLTGL